MSLLNISMSCVTVYPGPFGDDLDAVTVCGDNDCTLTNDGVAFAYTRNVFLVDVDANSNIFSAATQIIGHVTVNDSGETPKRCTNVEGPSPFGIEDITEMASDGGLKFKTTRTEELKIDVDSSVKSDMDLIKSLTNLPTDINLESIEVELKNTYKSLKGKKLVRTGTYHIFSLKNGTIKDLRDTNKYKDCVDFLKGNSARKLIMSAGIVKFSFEYDMSFVSSMKSELKSKLKSKGVEVDLGIEIDRKVNESIQQSSKDVYQIIEVTRESF
jgi:hypothetical protein